MCDAQVLPGLGLAVTLYDVLSIEGGFIYPRSVMIAVHHSHSTPLHFVMITESTMLCHTPSP